MTSLPDRDVELVQRWCRARTPDQHQARVRIEADIADRHVTIVECQPLWQAEGNADWTRTPVARLRFVKGTGMWSLLWRDRNLRFHAYDRLPPSPHVEVMLAEVEDDPTALFWG